MIRTLLFLILLNLCYNYQVQKAYPIEAQKIVTYVNRVKQWWPPSAIAEQIDIPTFTNSPYNVVIYAFWRSESGSIDIPLIFEHPMKYLTSNTRLGRSDQEIRKNILDLYHQAGKKLLLSAFGDSDDAATKGKNATEVCRAFALYVKNMGYDGKVQY